MKSLEVIMKRKSKHKKNTNKIILTAIIAIGICLIGAMVYMIGILGKGVFKTSPQELLIEYMNYIPEQSYEQMYAMLNIEASGNISQEDFIKRNSAIYEGIEVQNMTVEILTYDEEQMIVTYQTSFDTVAGTISFENEALFLKGEEGYTLVWDDSLIFPNLASTDKVRVHTGRTRRNSG